MDTLRVLVTDDELGMRLGVLRTLRDFTVHVADVDEDVALVVDQAESGEEALEKIHAQPPDILLLDHKMPGISGLEVLDRIAAAPTDMLTIMITAYASIETAVSATKRGAYDFLAKPFTPDELKSTIRKAAARLVLAKQARKLAEEKQQVRFEFIRVLAHELNAPLNAVAGYLDLMQTRSLGEQAAAYDEMIGRTLLRIDGMKKLIRDLLDLTRIESGRRNRQLAYVDLSAAARTAIETVQADAAARNIMLAVHAQGGAALMADPGEIEMLLNNLISNAVKYNRDGGRVDVTITRQEAEATIVVADTGIGMTPDEVSHIFAEFARVKNEKTNHIPGSGLGLSIVKKLAQLYDGDVKVASQPDVGTSFSVVLKANAVVRPGCGPGTT
jgi:two-component system, sensor histidine kinase and response regulator